MIEQRWSHIIPVTFVMYTIAFVDRTNVSLALPSMSRDLHMDPAQAGAASGIFFLGYVLLQIPAGYLASHWSPKKLISIMLVLWGACSAATGFVHTWHQFALARFLLGLAEGGVWPATLVLISRWFPRIERARANAYWMLCLPTAVVVSSPISGWILGRWDWRVLLISEGIVPILWLVIWLARIDDYPSQARWITSDERNYLERTLRLEASDAAIAARGSFFSTLVSKHVLVMMVVSFLISAGTYGYLFWLPSVLDSSSLLPASSGRHFTIGILNAIPYVFAAIGMVLISRHSDSHHERAWHVAACLGWAGICLIAGALIGSRSPASAFVMLCLVSVGSFGLLGPFWSIPTEVLPPAVAGSAFGLIQLSNLGGIVGPTLIGYLNKRTGSFTGAFIVLGIGWLVGALLSLLLRAPRSR